MPTRYIICESCIKLQLPGPGVQEELVNCMNRSLERPWSNSAQVGPVRLDASETFRRMKAAEAGPVQLTRGLPNNPLHPLKVRSQKAG